MVEIIGVVGEHLPALSAELLAPAAVGSRVVTDPLDGPFRLSLGLIVRVLRLRRLPHGVVYGGDILRQRADDIEGARETLPIDTFIAHDDHVSVERHRLASAPIKRHVDAVTIFDEMAVSFQVRKAALAHLVPGICQELLERVLLWIQLNWKEAKFSTTVSWPLLGADRLLRFSLHFSIEIHLYSGIL